MERVLLWAIGFFAFSQMRRLYVWHFIWSASSRKRSVRYTCTALPSARMPWRPETFVQTSGDLTSEMLQSRPMILQRTKVSQALQNLCHCLQPRRNAQTTIAIIGAIRNVSYTKACPLHEHLLRRLWARGHPDICLDCPCSRAVQQVGVPWGRSSHRSPWG